MNSLSHPLPDGTLLHYAWFAAMHTRIDLALLVPDEETGACLAGALHSEIRRIELLINKFDPASEVSLLNRNRRGIVSSELFGIIGDAMEWHRKTGGLFDITASSRGSGINHIHLDAEKLSVTLKDKTTLLDFSGYAKGYALDRCVDIINASPVRNALLNFGNSSVAALGSHPCGEGWKIGVETPWESSRPCLEYTLPPAAFLSTSGNHPDRPAHIIDPHTGRTLIERTAISVVTRSGVSGEALSTALFAAPAGQRRHLLILPECLALVE